MRTRSTRPGRRRRLSNRLLGLALAVVAVSGFSASSSVAATDVFVRANPLVDGRWVHATVRLGDGRVLVAGGWGPIGGGYITIKASAELYDPPAGTWTATGEMTAPRAGAVAALVDDGRVFIAGGESASPAGGLTTVRSIELYDARTGTFSAAGELPFVPTTATAVPGGKVLVTEASGRAVLFDPTDNSVVPTGHMLVARSEAMVARLADGRVLFAGGAYTNTAELYDVSTGMFSATGNMTIDRYLGTATLLADGRVAIAGGVGGWLDGGFLVEQDSVEAYDPQSGAFSPSGRLSRTRLYHASTLLPSGRVLVTGGHPFSGAGALDDAEVYDPSSGHSSGLVKMTQARRAHSLVALDDGSVLVAGGTESPGTSELFFESFTDTMAPVISVPDSVTNVASSPDGAVVLFDVSATDDVDSDPAVSCEPASGSLFPIGTTRVRCRAVDDAGNTASAEFDVVVLAPLGIELLVERRGEVNQKVGLATLRGTVSCNNPATVYLSGELTQTIANRAILSGFFSTQFACSPPATQWSVQVTASNGRYKGGEASFAVAAGACDQFTCDSVQATGTVKLRR